MARSWLRDTVDSEVRDAVVPVEAALDDDVAPGRPEPATVNPSIEVRQRSVATYDDDGNPTFTWTSVVTGEAVMWETTTEIDPTSGITFDLASATVLYGGETRVTTAAVVVALDAVWAVRDVDQYPDRLELRLERASGGAG